MDKAILMNADIDKSAEIDYISYGSGKYHTGLQIVHIHNVISKFLLWESISYITPRLFQFSDYIEQGRFPDAELIGKLCRSVF